MGRGDESGHTAFDPLVDVPPEVDVDRPSAARMYDYYLGGSAHFAVDRQAAEQALAAAPGGGDYTRANRSFLRRVVGYLCRAGIDQFLDLGSGIPTVGNVHEVAHEHNPASRIAYVDIESVAVAHARQLLGTEPRVTVTQGDLRRPDTVLSAPGVAGLLDFTRPVAVLAISILPFIPDSDEPVAIMAAYRQACVPGSYLAVSHGSPVTLSAEQVRRSEAVYRHTTTPLTWRSRDEIAAFLPGYRLVEPGLVLLGDWHPDPGEHTPAEATNGYGALGFLPGPC
ncbi:SAM-dependent methyltransferase [Haloactinomyces albus]|uniref:S-adenosyl methyltransferase n=1 Tax=Haloactinomyces albus TaxID=1352928 RepID=A0AAE3ZB66_9ACTN|nr:SAM-dependent methyltransferase [Haloactinomyces albus]MDR7299894.1 hypothetical protein [Haloactinomyces albus]